MKATLLTFALFTILYHPPHVACSVKLNDVFLRFAIIHNPPWDTITRGSNGTYTYTGTSKNIALWLAKRLNFKHTFVLASEAAELEYGIKEAGINLIAKKMADLSTFHNTPTMSRRKQMGFLKFFGWQDNYKMIGPKSGEKNRILAFISPFESTVWFSLAASFIVIIAVMCFLIRKLQKCRKSTIKKSSATMVGDYTMYTVNVLTNHGDYQLKEVSYASFFFLLYFWLLGASVLVYSYSSIIVSSLTAPKLEPGINSYEDLITSSNVRLLIRSDVSLGQSILKGENEVFKRLAEIAKRFPDSVTNSLNMREKLLLTGRYAHPNLETFCRSFIAEHYNVHNNEKCRFQLSDSLELPTYNYYFPAISYDCPYNDELSIGLMQYWETGITRKDTYSSIPNADECFVKTKNSQHRPLNLSDLSGAFLLLLVGLALSTVAFLFEITPKLLHRLRHLNVHTDVLIDLKVPALLPDHKEVSLRLGTLFDRYLCSRVVLFSSCARSRSLV